MMDYMEIAIPLVTGLTAVATQIGLPKKLSPLLSLALGVFSAFLLTEIPEAKSIILNGLIVGLSSVGLYSAPKNLIQYLSKQD